MPCSFISLELLIHDFVNNIKGTRIQPQFLFLMEKSILYAKITVSKKKLFQNGVLNII